MDDQVMHYVQALEDEIGTDERSADELADLARHLRSAGYGELASCMSACGRRMRVMTLELHGRLAAMRHQGDASSI